MSTQRPRSAVASAATPRNQASVSTAAPTLSLSQHQLAASKEKAIRQDPTLARSFRGHHGSVLSACYAPILVKAIDTKLPGYTTDALTGIDEGSSPSPTPYGEIGGTVSSRARAQKAAN